MEHALNTIITQKGLDYLTTVIGPMIPQALYESAVPDIVGEANGLQYSLSNFQFSYLDMQGIVAKWVDRVGVSAGCRDVSLTLLFDYSFIYTNYPPFTFKGSDGAVIVDNMNISVVCKIYSTEDGAEALEVVANSTTIDAIELKIGSSSFVNLILSIMTPVLTNTLESVLSDMISQIIEMIINPSISLEVVVPFDIEKFISVGSDKKKNTNDDLYENVFMDARLPVDPEFSDNTMASKMTARWFDASYNKCFNTCEDDNIIDEYDIKFDTITWNEDEVEYNQAEMPGLISNKEVQVTVKCDAWKSLWQTFINYGFFNSYLSSTNESGKQTKVEIPYLCNNMSQKKYVSEPQICYESVNFDTTLIGKYLPSFDIYYPKEQYNVRISYNIHSYNTENFEHNTMYTGIYVKIPGTLKLEVCDIYGSDWTPVIEIIGNLELSEVPSFVTASDLIQLDFYYHKINYYSLECEKCSTAGWYSGETPIEGSVLGVAMRTFINIGIIPFLHNWSIDFGLHSQIFSGFVLTDIETVFNRDLGCVTLGGNVQR